MQELGAVPLSENQGVDLEAWKDYPPPWTDKTRPQRFFSTLTTSGADNEVKRRDGSGRCKCLYVVAVGH